MTRLIAILCLALSATGFALTAYVFSDWNQTPAELPLPGPGYSVATPFSIATSGKFRLEAEVPRPVGYIEPVALPDLPPFAAKLRLEIEQEDKNKVDLVIDGLRHSGTYSAGNTEYYESDSTVTLPRGDYFLRLTGKDQTLSSNSGAIISFARVTPATETYLAAGLVRAISWFAFLAGILFAVLGARPNKSFKPNPLRGSA